MNSPTLQLVRGPRGLHIPAVRSTERTERIRRRVALALVVVLALFVGWIGGIGWSWSHARAAIVIKSPVFVRHAPAACILDGWDVNPGPNDLPIGVIPALWPRDALAARELIKGKTIRGLWMTDPARSRGWVSCWPLWEAGKGGEG